MLQEFRTFVMRGSVVDLAVGVVIGAAFTAIVNSLVKDILMPPVGMMLGGIDSRTLRRAQGRSRPRHAPRPRPTPAP